MIHRVIFTNALVIFALHFSDAHTYTLNSTRTRRVDRTTLLYTLSVSCYCVRLKSVSEFKVNHSRKRFEELTRILAFWDAVQVRNWRFSDRRRVASARGPHNGPLIHAHWSPYLAILDRIVWDFRTMLYIYIIYWQLSLYYSLKGNPIHMIIIDFSLSPDPRIF